MGFENYGREHELEMSKLVWGSHEIMIFFLGRYSLENLLKVHKTSSLQFITSGH